VQVHIKYATQELGYKVWGMSPLNDRAIQRDFARDPVAWAAHEYLSIETMSIAS
jgi:hypothetical protein